MPTMGALSNEALVLASRPDGMPGRHNFREETGPVPQPGPGEVLLETQWLSIEPYMALGMAGSMPSTPTPGAGRIQLLCDRYVAGVELGAVMCGPTISRVLASHNDSFAEGSLVLAYSGWQRYAIDDGSTLRGVPLDGVSPTASLGVLGLPGLTAYAGVRLAAIRPGDTFVVSAALGAVGSLAGQLARLRGARSIGVASGPEKCRELIEELGFDAAVDRLSPTFTEDLATACPDGIDVYFENVGGPVWWAVFDLLNAHGRVVISGLASHYVAGAAAAEGADRSAALMQKAQLQRLNIRGFSVFDHADWEAEFLEEVADGIRRSAIRYREDVVSGLSSAPDALARVLQGHNRGKMIVRLAGDT